MLLRLRSPAVVRHRPPPAPLLALALTLLAAPLGAQQPSDHPRLVSSETAQCDVCHAEVTTDRAHVHAPAADDCTICHELSLSAAGTTVALVEAEPELCLVCHDDKAAAVEMELATPHPPAADSCLACHDPHATEQARLLVARAAELCAECHDADDLAASHGGQLTAETDCARCHEPHGSDNPTMLAASRLHAPFADGSCAGCHRQPFAGRARLRARGERLCTACHGEFEEHPGGSRHAALVGDGHRAGCLSCHDPHMSDRPKILLAAGNALCARCHADLVRAAGAETGHPPAGEDCLVCHRPHVAEQAHLLSEPEDELCASCHDLQPAPQVAAAPPIEIVGAGASDFGPAAVVSAADYDNGTGQPALCAEPFPAGTWTGQIVVCERGAVLRVAKSRNVAAGGAGGLILVNRAGGPDDLFADPHAIPAVHLGTAAAARLGDWLRAAGGSQARLAGSRLLLERTAAPAATAPDLATVHLGADLERLDCLGCHSPHGEGNPKLLARHLHPPVEDGCDTCHEGGHDELMEGGGTELCLFCHDDVGEAAAAAEVPHDAMELADCTDCHNPHASAQEKLVSGPAAGPCADCHDEQAAGAGEVAHGAIELLGCRACHEPHGGQREKLLRLTGPELCLSCHPSGGLRVVDGAPTATLLNRFEVPAEVAAEISSLALSADGLRNHPVAGHRVLGLPTAEELTGARVQTTFTGELSCLSCHDPHKGRSARLFRWGAATTAEACAACHVK